MNRALLILFVLITVNNYAQENSVLISLPNTKALYTGYDNLVKISFNTKKIKNVTFECEGCDTIRPVNLEENEWLIRVDTLVPVRLIVKNKRGKLIKKEEFKVFPPPVPIVYLDTVDAQSKLTKTPRIISLKLEESVPLRMSFFIKSWSVTIGSKEFIGVGRNISQDVQDYLKITIKDGCITVE